MTEITEDMMDLMLTTFVAVMLFIAALAFAGAGLYAAAVGQTSAVLAMTLLSVWVFLWSHALLTDGTPHKVLDRSGILPDVTPADELETKVWGEN